MSSTYRFLAVLAIFALAAVGTIWFAADAHRGNASRSFAELDASDILLNSMLIRESALRGFAQTRQDVGRTTCIPSLVGGAVIGSVLVAHPSPLAETTLTHVIDSVGQSAPVLANLRNLAVAEIRAATDVLTGLPNARALRENLTRMIAQATCSEQPLAAIRCDLDHFKEINDVYGHDKGDEALAAASAALRAGVRESDLAGRYDGEEFLILLPDTALDGAVIAAEKLRGEISRIAVSGVTAKFSASFGVASFPADAPDAAMLIRMADRALYAAKASGRNCVVGSTELLAATTS